MNTIQAFLLEFQENDPANRVPKELAKNPEYTGRKIFSGLVCGAADADNDILASLKGNEEAKIDLRQPSEWLAGAKSVLSFFMPFERWITEENAGSDWPTDAWLHGRIEGQAALNKVTRALVDGIREEGYGAVAPSLDPSFILYKEECTSNWSERHVAYACGLGTFGLSRGIITELGMAGRFSSLVTTLPFEPTPGAYKGLLEYCSKCGTCVGSCPVNAISIERLKDNLACDAFMDEIKRAEDPYYGCGKCQSGMPCAYEIPGRG